MLLFCLPCAGGYSSMYFPWTRRILQNTIVVPLEIKGHGRKVREKFSCTLREEVEAIFEDIQPIIRNNGYSIFGHSMGALLAYELYYKIAEEELPPPSQLFFSSSTPPHLLKQTNIDFNLLSDEELLQHCVSMGGISEEILNQQSILDYFIPIIRNDYNLMNEYLFKRRVVLISSKVSIFRGTNDFVSVEESKEWEKLTSEEFNLTEFEGNHFYLQNQQNNILSVIDNMFENNN